MEGAAQPSIELTVIIPCLNAEHLLPGQLQALAADSVSIAWEVVIVDNASTDRTADVAWSFSERLPLRVVVEERRGRHFACNTGAVSAHGVRLAFVDADDRVLPGYVDAMNRALKSSDVVGGRLVHGVLGGASTEDVGRVQEEGLLSSLGFWPQVSGANFGVTRAAFQAVRGFDTDVPFGEDIDLSWRLHAAGYRASFDGDAAVVYAQRDDLVSTFKQHFRFGRGHVRLFRKYRSAGMPRRGARSITLDWFATVRSVPFLGERGVRARVVRRLARNLGHIDGSIRSRVLYL